MQTTSDVSLTSPPIPSARWGLPPGLIAALIRGVQAAVGVLGRPLRRVRRRAAWRDDLPWDVGMDHLAEQAYRSWILRP